MGYIIIELLLKVTGKEKESADAAIKQELETLRKEIKNLPSQLLLGTVKLGELSTNINRLNEQLQKPVSSRIEHKHELHKGFLIIISLFLLSVILICALINSYQNNKQYKANDLKYRYLKVADNTAILKLCNITDSLYQKNEDSFRIRVEQEERRLIRQAEDLRLAGEKESEAKSLKIRAGRR